MNTPYLLHPQTALLVTKEQQEGQAALDRMAPRSDVLSPAQPKPGAIQKVQDLLEQVAPVWEILAFPLRLGSFYTSLPECLGFFFQYLLFNSGHSDFHRRMDGWMYSSTSVILV